MIFEIILRVNSPTIKNIDEGLIYQLNILLGGVFFR